MQKRLAGTNGTTSSDPLGEKNCDDAVGKADASELAGELFFQFFA